MSLSPGVVLAGRYRLERELGRGGMGSVFRATDLTLGRAVAIKALLSEALAESDTLARFDREARAIGALGHPHIGALFDFQADGDTPFLVMELIDGESLRSLLDREGKLPVARAVHIARQILSALGAAHQAGIIHRDIKPSNVMVGSSSLAIPDLVKIVDFGIARVVSGDANAALTSAGVLLGTPAYMAPEQTVGLSFDARIDIHAVGTCLFEMLAGFNPFAQGDMRATLRAVRSLVPPSLSTVRADVPAPVAAAVARALHKDPAGRFPTATELAGALDARVDLSAPIDATPTVTTEPLPSAHPEATKPDGPSPTVPAPPSAAHRAPPARTSSAAIGVIACLGVIALGVTAFALWLLTQARRPPAPAPAFTASTPIVPVPSSSPAPSVAPPPASVAVKASGSAGATGSCICLPTNGPDTVSLCRTKGSPQCRCQSYAVNLCPVPFVKCASPSCPDYATCPVSGFDAFRPIPGARQGEACSGYGFVVHPGEEIENEHHVGAYECTLCTSATTYPAPSGAPCRGFHGVTGIAYAGVVSCP